VRFSPPASHRGFRCSEGLCGRSPWVGPVGRCPNPTTADSLRLGLISGVAGTIDGGGPQFSGFNGLTRYHLAAMP